MAVTNDTKHKKDSDERISENRADVNDITCICDTAEGFVSLVIDAGDAKSLLVFNNGEKD